MAFQIDLPRIGRIISGGEVDLHSLEAADWAYLIAEASSEGVSPLIYWTLLQRDRLDLLPEAARNSLSAAYAVTAMHNERIFQELEVLAVRLHRAGIETVILKGGCFALTIYPEPGLRPMGDLDLLVRPDRLPDAVAIAKSRGFSDTLPEASFGLDALLSHHVRLQTSGPMPLTLELHHCLVAQNVFTYSVPMAWFWSQTERLDWNALPLSESLRVLTPEAQLLYGSAHAMLMHGGRGAPLRWFYDIHLLVVHYRERLNWTLLLSQAREFGWSSALEAALHHTQANFGTRLPDDVLTSLRATPDRHRALVARLQRRPATRTLDEQQKLTSLNWYGRIRVALALVAPGPAYMTWRYQLTSPWGLPPAYLRRWAGIMLDGVRTLVVLVRR